MSSLASLPIPAQTALLLVASNVFMTFAWYGHLRNLASAPWYVAAHACCRGRPTASDISC